MNLELLRTLCNFINLFKFNFTFRFSDNRKQFATPLGLVFSLVIYGVLIFFFVSSDMIKKKNPSTIFQNIPKNTSPSIHLKKNTFKPIFGIGNRNLESFGIDPDMLELRVYGSSKKVNLDTKGDQKWIPTNFSTHRCSAEEINQANYINPMRIIIGYCVDDGYHWDMEGSFFDPNETQFLIELRLCENTPPLKICKSDVEIQTFLQDKYFVLFFQDSYVDFNDYENPVKFFPHVEKIILTPSSQSTSEIYLVKGEMFDDDSFLLESEKYLNFFSKNSGNFYSIARNFHDNTPIAKFIFGSSQNLRQNTRTYQKLTDVLGRLSGIANLLIVSGFICLNFYQQTLFTLYFIKNVIFSGDKLKNLMRNTIEISLVAAKLKEKKEANFEIEQGKLSKRGEISCEIVNNIQSQKNKQNVNFSKIKKKISNRNNCISEWLSFIHMKFKRILRWKLTVIEEFYFNAEKKLEESLNIENVMQKIQKMEEFISNFNSNLKPITLKKFEKYGETVI